jgi:hypothetical protein
VKRLSSINFESIAIFKVVWRNGCSVIFDDGVVMGLFLIKYAAHLIVALGALLFEGDGNSIVNNFFINVCQRQIFLFE